MSALQVLVQWIRFLTHWNLFVPMKELFAAKTKVSAIIQTDDIETKFQQRFFLGTIADHEGFGYRCDSALLEMKSRDRTDDLDLFANL